MRLQSLLPRRYFYGDDDAAGIEISDAPSSALPVEDEERRLARRLSYLQHLRSNPFATEIAENDDEADYQYENALRQYAAENARRRLNRNFLPPPQIRRRARLRYFYDRRPVYEDYD